MADGIDKKLDPDWPLSIFSFSSSNSELDIQTPALSQSSVAADGEHSLGPLIRWRLTIIIKKKNTCSF